MKKTLLLVLGSFSVVVLIFMLMSISSTNQLKKTQQEIVAIDNLAQELQHHKDQLAVFSRHDDQFDQMARFKSEHQKSIVSFWNNFQLKLSKSSISKWLYSEIEKCKRTELELFQDAAFLGYKDEGYMGKMRQIIHELEEKNPLFNSRILSLRRHEKDYIMRLDDRYAQLLHTEINTWKNNGNAPKELMTYELYFDSVSQRLERMYASSDFGTHATWFKNVELLQLAIRKFRSQQLLYGIKYAKDAQNKQLIISIISAILLVGGSLLISHRISRQVRLLQSAMNEFITSNYQAKESFSRQLPRNEIGQIALHFLKMARKIRNDMILLEDRVTRRTKSLEEKNILLEKQHLEIVESLEYAKNLQQSLLVSRQRLLEHFHEAYIHYSPKQHVGGDFFWMKECTRNGEQMVFFAVADCTGHGVPGALLSVLGMTTLDELFASGANHPATLLTQLRITISRRLNNHDKRQLDGMDISIVGWNKSSQKIAFAGAQLPVWILRDASIIELKGQRIPVGFSYQDVAPYEELTESLIPGDRLLFFTDGLVDQFGERSNKKLGKKQLRFLLQKQCNQTTANLFQKLVTHFQYWKGESEQTDDCTIILLEPLKQKNHQEKIVVQRDQKLVLV